MVDAKVNIKAEKLRTYLVEKKINGFSMQNIGDAAGTTVFRTNLQAGNNLFPIAVILDGSVYIFIQVRLMSNLTKAVHSKKFESALVALNNSFRLCKFSLSEDGSLLYSINFTATDAQFDPGFVISVLQEILRFLSGDFVGLEKVLRLTAK